MSKSPRKSTPIDVDAFIDDVEVPAEPSLTVPPPIAHVDSLLYDEELAAKRGRSVELHEDQADDTPMPASYIALEHEDSAGKKKLSAETGSEKKGKRSSSEALDERMQSKLASGGLQPTVSASAEAREQRSNNAQRFLQLPTRPTSAVSNTHGARNRSVASTNDTTSPSVPVLTATLVEDEPEAPVYDAVPVPTNVEDDRSRRKKYVIIFSALVLVIGALVAIIGVVSTSRNGDSAPGGSAPPTTASPVGTAPEPTVAPGMGPEPTTVEPTTRPAAPVTAVPDTPWWELPTAPPNETSYVKRVCSQILVVETLEEFTDVQVGIYQLLMQSYTAEFGYNVAEPQIVTTCEVIRQDFAWRRRWLQTLIPSGLWRRLQTTLGQLVMEFTMEYKSRYGYDVENYPQQFGAFINSNLERVTADMEARFLPVVEAQEVIVSAQEPAAPTRSPVVSSGEPSIGNEGSSTSMPTTRPQQTTLTPFAAPISSKPTRSPQQQISADGTCSVTFQGGCGSSARSVTSSITFTGGAIGSREYEATIVYHWGPEDTSLGAQQYITGQKYEENESYQYAVDGQYTAGYSVTFGEGAGRCEGRTHSDYFSVTFDTASKSCVYREANVAQPTTRPLQTLAPFASLRSPEPTRSPVVVSSEEPTISNEVPCEERANKGQCEVDSIGVSLECPWTGQRCITLPVPGVVGGS